MADRRVSRRGAATTVGLAAIGVLLTAVAVQPPTSGALALLAIFLPHVWIGLVVGLAVGLVRHRSRPIGLSFAVIVMAGAVRFGGEWVSVGAVDAVGDGRVLRLVSWNLEAGSRPSADYVDPLMENDADVVALQELTPEAAAVIAAAPEIQDRWPYRILSPEATVWGMGILSRFPLGPATLHDDPVIQEVAVELGDGETVWLINAHPQRSPIQHIDALGIPVGVETAERDQRLVRVRAAIEAALRDGDSLIAIGDFNVAPTEGGYRALADGLLDVHAEVGSGLGWTWRPDSAEWTHAGLLRIDYAFVDPSITPIAMTVACGHVGDHCLLVATVRLPVP